MRMKLIGACVAAMSICLPVAEAQQVTIEQFTKVMGDFLALATICPDLDGRNDAFGNYLKTNGITKKMMEDETGYFDDVKAEKKASFERRKSMSVEDNCNDALSLYGEDGTIIKGALKHDSVAADSK